MKKVLICNNCKAESPFYAQTCTNCNSFLRSKMANVDLWSTLWNILDSPIKTAETIIQSDHKNFVISLLAVAAIKIALSFYIISNALSLYGDEIEKGFNFIIISAFIFIVLLISCSIIITYINSLMGLKNRIKDNLAIYTYSFIPIVLAFIFLTPIQIALFGTYWFTFNPSPLLFKPMVSYVLIFIEGIFFLWSFFLLVSSTYSQSKNIPYSILVGSIMTIALISGMFLLMGLIY